MRSNGRGDGKARQGHDRHVHGSPCEGDRVFLPGLGTLTPVPRAERIGRNPKTGGSCTIPARTTVKFTAAKRLKDALNQKKKGYA